MWTLVAISKFGHGSLSLINHRETREATDDTRDEATHRRLDDSATASRDPYGPSKIITVKHECRQNVGSWTFGQRLVALPARDAVVPARLHARMIHALAAQTAPRHGSRASLHDNDVC